MKNSNNNVTIGLIVLAALSAIFMGWISFTGDIQKELRGVFKELKNTMEDVDIDNLEDDMEDRIDDIEDLLDDIDDYEYFELDKATEKIIDKVVKNLKRLPKDMQDYADGTLSILKIMEGNSISLFDGYRVASIVKKEMIKPVDTWMDLYIELDDENEDAVRYIIGSSMVRQIEAYDDILEDITGSMTMMSIFFTCYMLVIIGAAGYAIYTVMQGKKMHIVFLAVIVLNLIIAMIASGMLNSGFIEMLEDIYPWFDEDDLKVFKFLPSLGAWISLLLTVAAHFTNGKIEVPAAAQANYQQVMDAVSPQLTDIASKVKDVSSATIKTAVSSVQSQVAPTTPCASCGGAVPANTKFCNHCGTAMPEAPAPAQAQTGSRFCTSCGGAVEAGMKFCKQCGNKMD